MTLKDFSCRKTSDAEWIPNCQANGHKNGFYLGLKHDGTREDYVYNLNNFQFSFRELDSSAEESNLYNEKR